jgi:formylmethanofuran dehydrogenase subunit E
MPELSELLAITEAQHKHLCPRQVLGVRMGMFAAELLGIALPQTDKRVLAFVETDGCFVDGVSAATGCTLGHRTLRHVDHGKTAAVFVDTKTDFAIRIHPASDARKRAACCQPEAQSRWHAQLQAYQLLSNSELFVAREVVMTVSIRELISRPGVRVNCDVCGEEIINEREIINGGLTLCRGCAGDSYFQAKDEAAWLSINLAEASITCESH